MIVCECERTSAPNLAQVLHIANGELLQRKVSDKKARVALLLKSDKTDDQIIAELYMLALCRWVTKEEIASCKQIISAASNRKEGMEDVLWALCNTREFLFVH